MESRSTSLLGAGAGCARIKGRAGTGKSRVDGAGREGGRREILQEDHEGRAESEQRDHGEVGDERRVHGLRFRHF